MYIYGVKSKFSPTEKLGKKHNLFSWVTRMNKQPSFWAGYISGDNKITKEQIDFLHKNKCKACFIFNEFDELSIGMDDGIPSGILAVQRALSLGIPQNKNIAIFAEIPYDWNVNHNWMLGYALALKKYGYIPGFIGNTDSSINYTFGRQCSHYAQAVKSMVPELSDTIYWSTQPIIFKQPEKWEPFCPSELLPADMALWSCGNKIIYRSNGIYANEIYTRDKHIIDFMW